jgi:hypothetical protein
MKTRNFWLGVAAGALAVGAVWYWMAGTYPEPHKHVWGRWEKSDPVATYPMNARSCKLCGFRELRIALGECTPPEK